jgi:hypothetical protein
MDDLEKRVAGDWFDLRENAENPWDLEDYLRLELKDYVDLMQELRLSVEEGVIEYKRKVLVPIFGFLDSMKYDSRGFDELSEQARSLVPLIYCLLVQRLIARGSLRLRKDEISVQAEQELGIKEIIQDVNQRIKEEPKTGQNPYIKNIIMQVSRYKKELEDMKSLSPKIPAEKAKAISDNFKKTFNTIHKSIAENYASFLREEMQALYESVKSNPLTRYDVKSISKIYTRQAQEAARIRSTLLFAVEEGYRTRAYLVDIVKRKDSILQTFREEKAVYRNLTGSEEEARALTRAFTGEIIYTLRKQIRRLSRSEAAPT